MKVTEKKAYYNDRCYECRRLLFRKGEKVYVITPNFRGKFWKLCKDCFAIIKRNSIDLVEK